jgi:hypothetical protein
VSYHHTATYWTIIGAKADVVATWADLDAAQPALAQAGRALFYQFGVGLAFLATVRSDGGPRLHPICVIVAEGGLWAFIIPSPKCADLRRNGSYALHAYPPEQVDDEFYVTGRATEVLDPTLRAAVAAAYQNTVADDHVLFHFDLARCLLGTYRERGAWPPAYTRWSADE